MECVVVGMVWFVGSNVLGDTSVLPSSFVVTATELGPHQDVHRKPNHFEVELYEFECFLVPFKKRT